MANRVNRDGGNNTYTLERGITLDDQGDVVSGVNAKGGNDTLNLYASDGLAQIHAWGGAGDDTLNLSFGSESGGSINSFSHGYHVRGDFDGAPNAKTIRSIFPT